MKRSTPIRQPRTRHEAEAMISHLMARTRPACVGRLETRPSIINRRLRRIWLQTHTLG